jgi:hypothetical protein
MRQEVEVRPMSALGQKRTLDRARTVMRFGGATMIEPMFCALCEGASDARSYRF